VQSPTPLQSVPQPAKLKPLSAVAVSVTDVPAAKSAAQVEETQSRPLGEDVTRPFPWTITLRRRWLGGGGGSAAKVALTSRSPSKVRSHVPVPLHAPDHETKDAPESGTATRWTWVPEAYGAVQLPRQSAPAPRTRPLPAAVILRFTCVGVVRPEPPSGVEGEMALEEPQLAAKTSARDPRIRARNDSPKRKGKHRHSIKVRQAQAIQGRCFRHGSS